MSLKLSIFWSQGFRRVQTQKVTFIKEEVEVRDGAQRVAVAALKGVLR